MKIKKINFDEQFYVKTPSNKTQITLHHTAGGGKAEDVANYWKTIINPKTNKPQRICTSYIIEKDGTIAELFDSNYGGGHIGDCSKSFKLLNLPEKTLSPLAVGIEIISMGALIERDGKLYNEYGKLFKNSFVKLETKFRGTQYFEKYTDEQIKAVEELLPILSQKHNIPLIYNSDIWDITARALMGELGVFSHTSYRLNKTDIYPDINMINMLKTLK